MVDSNFPHLRYICDISSFRIIFSIHPRQKQHYLSSQYLHVFSFLFFFFFFFQFIQFLANIIAHSFDAFRVLFHPLISQQCVMNNSRIMPSRYRNFPVSSFFFFFFFFVNIACADFRIEVDISTIHTRAHIRTTCTHTHISLYSLLSSLWPVVFPDTEPQALRFPGVTQFRLSPHGRSALAWRTSTTYVAPVYTPTQIRRPFRISFNPYPVTSFSLSIPSPLCNFLPASFTVFLIFFIQNSRLL